MYRKHIVYIYIYSHLDSYGIPTVYGYIINNMSNFVLCVFNDIVKKFSIYFRTIATESIYCELV